MLDVRENYRPKEMFFVFALCCDDFGSLRCASDKNLEVLKELYRFVRDGFV